MNLSGDAKASEMYTIKLQMSWLEESVDLIEKQLDELLAHNRAQGAAAPPAPAANVDLLALGCGSAAVGSASQATSRVVTTTYGGAFMPAAQSTPGAGKGNVTTLPLPPSSTVSASIPRPTSPAGARVAGSYSPGTSAGRVHLDASLPRATEGKLPSCCFPVAARRAGSPRSPVTMAANAPSSPMAAAAASGAMRSPVRTATASGVARAFSPSQATAATAASVVMSVRSDVTQPPQGAQVGPAAAATIRLQTPPTTPTGPGAPAMQARHRA